MIDISTESRTLTAKVRKTKVTSFVFKAKDDLYWEDTLIFKKGEETYQPVRQSRNIMGNSISLGLTEPYSFKTSEFEYLRTEERVHYHLLSWEIMSEDSKEIE